MKKKTIPKRRTGRKGGKKKTFTRKESGGSIWDQAARWYDSLVGLKGSGYQRDIIMPGAFSMMNLKKGALVLDLACGQGVFSRYLEGKGMKALGLDSSEELIRFAKRRSKPGIQFFTGDAGNSETLRDKKFDAIACLLAIQNIEKLDPVLKNVKRWLKPSGSFVMVMTHPCFRIPRQSNWVWDEERKMVGRRVDLYSSEAAIPILTPPMAHSKVYTQTYHRPLQSYFQSLAKAGLNVALLEEWSSNKTSEPGMRSKAENRARKEFPLFMAIKAVHSS